jgi:hypothetical protein
VPPDDWEEFDAWEARDRTLLEAAAHARAARLALLMGAPELDWLVDPELDALSFDRYALVPPDEEPA